MPHSGSHPGLQVFSYVKHPFFQYNYTYITSNRETLAFFIWRVADLGGASICRIVDFDFNEKCLKNKDIVLNLINSLICQCVKLDLAYIDCYTSFQILLDSLINYGFQSNRRYFLPGLIDPVDHSRKYLNGEYFINPNLKTSTSIHFEAMRGDGDQDRPFQSIYCK